MPWIAYMLTFIVTNSFLNIIAASHYIQLGYQAEGDTNAAVAVLTFSKYFVCGVKWGASELKILVFVIFETHSEKFSWKFESSLLLLDLYTGKYWSTLQGRAVQEV